MGKDIDVRDSAETALLYVAVDMQRRDIFRVYGSLEADLNVQERGGQTTFAIDSRLDLIVTFRRSGT